MSSALPLIQASLIGEALEAGPIGVLVADDDMRYVAVNRYACELLGYERPELLALSVTDIGAETDVAGDFDRFMADPSWVQPYRFRHKDGTVVSYETRAGETRLGGLQFYISVFWPSP